MSTHTIDSSPETVVVPKSRLTFAIILFLIALLCPVTGTMILASDASANTKMLAGFLFFPIPEAFDLAAIAILGKPGFAWLKLKLSGFFMKYAPPDKVSSRRYRFGLVLFLLPLIFGWVYPYLLSFLPMLASYRVPLSLAFDFVFVVSFFVLGGDFWDKVRALFVSSAKVVFPAEPETTGK